SQQQLSNAATAEDFEGYTITSTLLSYLGRVKYDFKGTYSAEFTVRRDGSSIFAPGYRYGTFPAVGASWVLSNEGLLNDVSAGSVDLFQKNSKNLILNQPLPPSSGFGSIQTNVGKVQNEGIELNLTYQVIQKKDLNLNVNFNVTYLKNTIKSLLPGKDTFASSG